MTVKFGTVSNCCLKEPTLKEINTFDELVEIMKKHNHGLIIMPEVIEMKPEDYATDDDYINDTKTHYDFSEINVLVYDEWFE